MRHYVIARVRNELTYYTAEESGGFLAVNAMEFGESGIDAGMKHVTELLFLAPSLSVTYYLSQRWGEPSSRNSLLVYGCIVGLDRVNRPSVLVHGIDGEEHSLFPSLQIVLRRLSPTGRGALASAGNELSSLERSASPDAILEVLRAPFRLDVAMAQRPCESVTQSMASVEHDCDGGRALAVLALARQQTHYPPPWRIFEDLTDQRLATRVEPSTGIGVTASSLLWDWPERLRANFGTGASDESIDHPRADRDREAAEFAHETERDIGHDAALVIDGVTARSQSPLSFSKDAPGRDAAVRASPRRAGLVVGDRRDRVAWSTSDGPISPPTLWTPTSTESPGTGFRDRTLTPSFGHPAAVRPSAERHTPSLRTPSRAELGGFGGRSGDGGPPVWLAHRRRHTSVPTEVSLAGGDKSRLDRRPSARSRGRRILVVGLVAHVAALACVAATVAATLLAPNSIGSLVRPSTFRPPLRPSRPAPQAPLSNALGVAVIERSDAAQAADAGSDGGVAQSQPTDAGRDRRGRVGLPSVTHVPQRPTKRPPLRPTLRRGVAADRGSARPRTISVPQARAKRPPPASVLRQIGSGGDGDRAR